MENPENRLPKDLESLLPKLEGAKNILAEAYGKLYDKTPEEVARARKEMRYALLSENGEILYCDLMTWAKSMEHGYRRIRQEDLPGGYWISTVFLGLNHNYNPFGGQPLWFETMIFGPPTGAKSVITGKEMKHGDSVYCERFSTIEEALQGHEAAKRWLERQEFED